MEVHVHDAPGLQNPAKVKIDDVYSIQEPLVDPWVGDISNGSELGGQRRRRTGSVRIYVSQRSLAHADINVISPPPLDHPSRQSRKLLQETNQVQIILDHIYPEHVIMRNINIRMVNG